MLNNRANKFVVCVAAMMFSNSVFAVASPEDVFVDAWAVLCTGQGSSGSDLDILCGSGVLTGGSAGVAAAGNNGGVFSGTGNSTLNSDRHNKKSLEERKKAIKKLGAAGDIFSAERLGFFASGRLTEIDRADTVLEKGYDSDVHGFNVGMDYIFNEQFVAGITVGYTDTDLDYNRNAGDTNNESVSVLVFANYNLTDNFIIDGYLGWTGIDFDQRRRISGFAGLNTFALSAPTANKFLSGLNLSYVQSFGALQITPLIKLDYSGTYIDGYTETTGSGLALRFKHQDIQSFKSHLGFDTSYAISVPWGVLLPRVQGSYVHEFLDQRRTISATFVQDVTGTSLNFQTDKPDRDYFIIGGSVSTVLTQSIQMFVDYERIEGHRYLNSYTVSGGVRVGF